MELALVPAVSLMTRAPEGDLVAKAFGAGQREPSSGERGLVGEKSR